METPTNKTRYYTVLKADIFSVTLGHLSFSVEASQGYHRVVVFENDKIKVINAVDKVEHESVKACHEYIKGLENNLSFSQP
jgi:hypothetical protein